MRAAQPIEVPLGSGRCEEVGLAIVWASATGVFGFWLARSDAVPALVHGIALVALAACAMLAWRSSRPMRGQLAWDGSGWCWLEPGTPSAIPSPGLRIALDGGSWLLLRDEPGRWCVVARSNAPQQWHSLRLALHANRPAVRPGQTS